MMEKTLYDMVSDLKITFVTISHRLTLRERHDQVLAIGDGKQGFTLTKIDKSLFAAETQRTNASKQVPSEQPPSELETLATICAQNWGLN